MSTLSNYTVRQSKLGHVSMILHFFSIAETVMLSRLMNSRVGALNYRKRTGRTSNVTCMRYFILPFGKIFDAQSTKRSLAQCIRRPVMRHFMRHRDKVSRILIGVCLYTCFFLCRLKHKCSFI